MQRTEEQNGRVQLEFMDRMLPIELTAELALPDYRSEISRLLWVRPVFLPPARFVGSGKIEFSGAVCYHILYTGPDGALYGADSEESYAFSVPRDYAEGFDAADGIEICTELMPDAVISRVLGPRKLSLRCRLHARVRGYANKNVTPRFRGEKADEEKILRLCDVADGGRMVAGETEHFQIGDRIEINDKAEGELRLIASRGSLFVPEVSASDGTVHCRGEALVTLLCCYENGAQEGQVPFTVARRIPFERDIPLEGVSPEWRVCASGEIGSVDVELEDGAATVTVGASMVAKGQCEDSVLLYRDVFLPGCCAEYQRKEERLWRPAFCGNRNFSISGERAYADIGLPADAVILDATADAEVRERQSEGNHTVLSGELRCHVLYCRSGEYATGEFSVPFRNVLDEAMDDMEVSCSVVSCRVSPVAEGLRADAELGFAVRACHQHPVCFLTEAVFKEAEPVQRCDLEICYPAVGESLWDVAKRYGVAPETVAAANGLSDEDCGAEQSLAGVRYLLVP